MIKAPKDHRAELLMPAGNLDRLKTAILYGADAVYAGTPDLSLRTQSAFSLDDVLEGIAFARARGKRVYLTLNLFSHNRDVEKLNTMIETLKKLQPDGIIIADPGVFAMVKEALPDVPLHVSTQANVCSWLTVQFWQNLGADLCVLAREVSFEELTEIREKCPKIKIETFVHGSMCMTYSGRCLLSNYMAERGANQGNCAHSCRWNYKVKLRLKDGRSKEIEINEQNKDLFETVLEEGYRPGEFMEIEEDDHGSYILNSKDLCLMPKLPDLLGVGVDSLKVEGRNKNTYYVGIVARAYRKAIDDWYEDPENWKADAYMNELNTVSNRGYTLAFHEGRLTQQAHDYDVAKSDASWLFAGHIKGWEEDHLVFELKNYLVSGDVLEFIPPPTPENPDLVNIRIRLYEFVDSVTGDITQKVSAGQGKAIKIPLSAFHAEDPETLKKRLPAYTVARRERPDGSPLELHLKTRRLSHRAESGKLSQETYEDAKARHKARAEAPRPSKKAPKSPDDGCCGRGCNGCLVFWQSDKYAKARTKLAEQKQGTRLPKNWDKPQ